MSFLIFNILNPCEVTLDDEFSVLDSHSHVCLQFNDQSLLLFPLKDNKSRLPIPLYDPYLLQFELEFFAKRNHSKGGFYQVYRSYGLKKFLSLDGHSHSFLNHY